MRPVTLTLDGFRSYASEVTIDWTGKRLVGIVGPIGAGKSSILDAVCFALYGKTPTEKSNQRSLIHQRADVGKVELVFEVDGERWKVIRALRRKGQSPHALYRIDPDNDGDEPLETVLGKAEVDERIEQVLGIDFDGFNRSVMLAQGRFSDFLRAGPTDRDKVLKGVFGLDKVDVMEQVAKRIRDEAKRDLEEYGRRRADLDNVRQLAALANETLAAAKERHQALQSVADRVAKADAGAGAAEQASKDASERTAHLEAIAAKMPNADVSRALLSASADQANQLAQARRALAEASQALVKVKEGRAKLLTKVGGEQGLGAARQQAARRGDAEERATREAQRVVAADEAVTRAKAAHKKAVEAAKAAKTQSTSAAKEAAKVTAAVEQAEKALHEGQHADMAAALRSGLSTGDDCPVCAQAVADLPDPAGSATDIDALEAAVATARTDRASASDVANQAAAELAAANEAVTHAKTSVDDVTTAVGPAKEAEKAAGVALAEIDAALKKALGGDPLTKLATLEGELLAAAAAISEGEEQQANAQVAVDASTKATEQAEGELRTLIATVAALAASLGLEPPSVTNADETDTLLKQVRDTWVAEQALATARREAAITQLAAATAERADALESIGLDPTDDFGKAVAGAHAAVANAEAEVKLRAETLAKSGDLDAEIVAKEAVMQLYDDLAKDLRPSAFLGYLLEEERAELARVSSAQFEQLSGGRYRFSDDGTFSIIDLTAAEQVRKASSLSGGETFLASLALALALAEMVGRGTGRLDAFFLDEGFGSLDAEHLDLAMAGIESLVSGSEDRLVVIVSHVAEMKERIEDLIVLDKDPATGSTIIASG